jgi:A/G-specific adenine glycosylase
LIFLFKLPETITAQSLEKFAEKIIPKWKSRDRHNALMDYWALELTARKTKIKPLSKQSKFEWSDRQVRWALLKKLVQSAECRVQSFMEDFPHKNVKKIINDMVKEELIEVKKWTITIAE